MMQSMPWRGLGIPFDEALQKAIWEAVVPAYTSFQMSFDPKREYDEAFEECMNAVTLYTALAINPPIWQMKIFTAVQFHMYLSILTGLRGFSNVVHKKFEKDKQLWKLEMEKLNIVFRDALHSAKKLSRSNADDSSLYEVCKAMGVTYF
jgi:hypothetical protein